MTASTTDRDLLEMIAQSNEQAFGLLYNRHWEPLFRFAFSILKDQATAEDIVQDVFVWLWEHRANRNIQSPPAYFKAAVKFKIANHIRSGNIRSDFFEEAVRSMDLAADRPPQEQAELRELQNVIGRAVADLPGKCRQIFQLSRESQLSNKEIASQLGISHKTVEKQMTIALQRLKSAVRLGIILLAMMGQH